MNMDQMEAATQEYAVQYCPFTGTDSRPASLFCRLDMITDVFNRMVAYVLFAPAHFLSH